MTSNAMMTLPLLLAALCVLPLALSAGPGNGCPAGCNCSTAVLYCRNTKMTLIPNISGSYTTLDFVNAKIDTLAVGVFSKVPEVTRISLEWNVLTLLNPGQFAPLTKLTYLSVEENELILIRSKTFDDVVALKELYLSYNKLTSLPVGLFSKLVNLLTLKIDYNDIKSVGAAIFNNLRSLTQLSMTNNQLVKLDVRTFHQLPSLTSLSLSSNLMGQLTVGLFDKLTLLRQLYLNGNLITDLALGLFDQLISLNTLNIDGNPFQNLRPGVLDKLKGMRFLLISKTKLTVLTPGLFNKMPLLTSLNLYSNLITRIAPGTFDNLAQLSYLELNHNNLSVLSPGTFDQLLKINYIDIKHNKLDLSRSICALGSVFGRASVFKSDSNIQAAAVQANALSCKSGSRLCYNFNGQRQMFFCSCPASQTYTGSRCVPTTTCKPGQVPPCDPPPVCVSRQSIYSCSCPFGSANSAQGCRPVSLTASQVTTSSAIIHVNMPVASLGNPRAVYILKVESTYPIDHIVEVVALPMSSKTAVIKNLRPGYMYEMKITKSFFIPVHVLTQQKVPVAPAVVAKATSNSIKVYFNTTTSGDWVTLEFCVTVRHTDIHRESRLCHAHQPITIKSLNPRTLYEYSATIVNTAGITGPATHGLMYTHKGRAGEPTSAPTDAGPSESPISPSSGKKVAGAVAGGLIGALVLVAGAFFIMRRSGHTKIGRSGSISDILLRRPSGSGGFFQFNNGSSTTSTYQEGGGGVKRASEV